MDNSKIDEIESGAASFLTGNDALAALVDKMLLDIYTEDEEETNLFLEGCDDEQIYQQLEVLHNNKILEENEELEIFEPSDNEEAEDDEEEDIDAEDDEEGVTEKDDREVEEGDDFAEGESEDEEGIEGLEDIEEDFDEDEAEEKLSKQASKIYGKTEIDDKFFSLREMEEICDEQEKNEEIDLDEEILDELYGDGGGDGKDLFGNDVDDEADEKGIMHDEFFKSNFEKRKDKVRQELDVLESEQVGDRPWHLMGETSARNRDGDELLGMDLDFDATRPDVVPTVEMTEDLEKIIIQRIRDKAYDDVERKTREMVEPAEAKRKLVPDEERKSLSQLYEQEYLQNNKDTDEDPVRKQIKEKMQKLFNQLDFLTYDTVVNQKEMEVKVISNGSALVSEEKGPSLVSEYASLAPEEVGGKSKGQFKIKAERTTEEIKRDRRQIKQKIKAKKAAGIEIKFKNPKRKSDVDLRPTDGKKTKWTNSSKVFRMLQDEAETGVLTAKAKAKEKKNLIMEKRRAKSFKL